MPISFDSALGIHPQALAIRAQRAEILASNIANADTPGYKARDIDFKSILGNVGFQNSTALRRTHPQHIQISSAETSAELLYRTPDQPSLDGNTVDIHREKSAFAENAFRYQASLQFLSNKFKGMMTVLRSGTS